MLKEKDGLPADTFGVKHDFLLTTCDKADIIAVADKSKKDILKSIDNYKWN
jgi:hypothetical protein